MLIAVSGCLPQKVERHELEIEPVLDHYALNGYTESAGEGLYVIPGSIKDAKSGLQEIVINGEPPKTVFSTGDELNFVVFRGVFPTGGFSIEIRRVEKENTFFFIFADYIDPGKGMAVTHAYTSPAVIIPIGRLERGNYRVMLLVTKVRRTAEGDEIVYEDREKAMAEFSVK
jgi:hypothetical protein